MIFQRVRHSLVRKLGQVIKILLYRLVSLYLRLFPYRVDEKVFANLLKKDYGRSPARCIEIMRSRVRDIFVEKNDILAFVKSNYPLSFDETIIYADEICLNKIVLFETFKVDFAQKIDWHSAIVTPQHWPYLYCKDLKRIINRIPEMKYCLELNRHQFLVILAKAYVLTKNRKYLDKVFYVIKDWIENNPYLMGVNWTSSLEVGVRAISWIFILYLLIDADAIEDHSGTVNNMFQYLYLHASFIAKNLTIKEISNNHLIGEVSALICVGLVFDIFKESDAWVSKGLCLLETELNKQTYIDGMDKEHSFDYHRFVLELCTLVMVIGKARKMELPREFFKRLGKMYEFSMYSIQPDGCAPMIGDDDNGRAFKLTLDSNKNILSVLSTGAVVFDRSDMAFVAQSFKEDSWWLLGSEGYKKFRSLVADKPGYASIAFKEAGQVIMRSGWEREALYLYFDGGKQGMGQAGHGHADALSFVLFARGRTLLADSGTYTYNGPHDWRDYFRGTSAHNTVTVDGVNQAVSLEPYDQFGWQRKADAIISHWYSSVNFDFLCGSQDGYERMSDPVMHRRYCFFVKNEYFIITDVMKGKSEHDYSFHFHLTPGVVSHDRRSNGYTTGIPKESNVLIFPVHDGVIDSSVVEGQYAPIQGWISQCYGNKNTSPVVIFNARNTSSFVLNTVVYPYKDVCPKVDVKQLKCEGQSQACSGKETYTSFELSIGNKRDIFIIASESEKITLFCSEFSTDAEYVYIRISNGALEKMLFINGSFLKRRNKSLFTSGVKIDYVEVVFSGNEAVVSVSEKAAFDLPNHRIVSTKEVSPQFV